MYRCFYDNNYIFFSIPQALIDRCAALSARPDTTQEITQAMDLLAETSNEVQAQLLEIQKLLEV